MKTALKLIATKYKGDVMNMSGPAHKADRVLIMRDLTGEKVPSAKCGVNHIERWLFEKAGIGAMCYAARREALAEWLKKESE